MLAAVQSSALAWERRKTGQKKEYIRPLTLCVCVCEFLRGLGATLHVAGNAVNMC